MIKPYSEAIIAIDLIVDYLNINDPFEIQNKIEEIFEMDIHINTIIDYLNIETEDYEKESYFISQDFIKNY